ncbi:hypothetical protein Pa4123_67620 [Phytohabitans aurantiacus]|jgi:hypothetical protein|uniref:Uncharacterized protein n=1 Tax=Phytohabitans aurantiacus TaxID=3016789 RepID=A0ABQ5R434_9ACTN|nr:hypothetical protein Pa4123_67620 [Phytohabitans aurantiacus]
MWTSVVEQTGGEPVLGQYAGTVRAEEAGSGSGLGLLAAGAFHDEGVDPGRSQQVAQH